MRKLKNIALWTAGILLSLVLIISGIVYLKKDEIVRSFQEKFNKNLRGEFTYSGLGLTFFSTFPQIGISVYGPVLVSEVHHENDTLLHAHSLDLSFDLWGVIAGSGSRTIREITLNEPFARIVVDSSGAANYDMWIAQGEVQPQSDTTSQTALNEVRIDYFAVSGGQLYFSDRSLNWDMTLEELDFETGGQLGEERYTFDLFARAPEASLEYEGIRYIDRVALNWDGKWSYHLDSSSLTFTGHRIRLNALELEAGGQLIFLPDRYEMDFNFNSPGEDIRQIISLIPAVYAGDLDRIETDGTLALNGEIKGPYGPGPSDYPAFTFEGRIVDGQMQYRDAATDIQNIQAVVDINKPQGSLELTEIHIPNYSLQFGAYPLEGNFFAAKLTGNPHLRGALQTDLELNTLKNVLPPDQFDRLSGHLLADLSFDFTYDQIEKKEYQNIDFSGNIRAEQLAVNRKNMPALSASLLTVDLSPAIVRAQMESLTYGASDVSGSLAWSDPLPFYFHHTPLIIEADLSGNRWLVDEWFEADEQEQQEAAEKEIIPSNEKTNQDPVHADIRLGLNELDYGSYHLEDLDLEAMYTGDELEMKRLDTRWQGSTISCRGRLYDVLAYSAGTGILKGSLDLRTDRLRLDDFYASESTPGEEQNSEPSDDYVLPEQTDLNVRFAADAFEYGKVKGEDLRAQLTLSDRVLELSDAGMNSMGGRIDIAGVYDTKEPEQPLFDFKYEFSNLQISALFSAVETFGLFAPIGKKVEGRLNSNLVLSGALDRGLSPVYDRLDASGYLATINAELPDQPFLKRLDEQLGFNALNRIDLKDLKTWFSIEDGRMNVNEFPFEAGGIEMSMEGSQYLDKSMDYTIHAVIPKEKITSTAWGREAERGFEWIRDQSKKAGISIDEIKQVELDIRMTGALDQPKFNIVFAGTANQSINEGIKSKVDTVKSELKDKLDTITQKVKEQAKEALDTVKGKAKKQARDLIEEQLKGGKDSTTQKPLEDIKKGGEENIDSLKDKIKNWNPFKKKKKKNDQ